MTAMFLSANRFFAILPNVLPIMIFFRCDGLARHPS